MSKQFLGVIVAIILIFVGIAVFGGNKSNGPGNTSGGSTGTLTEHIEGQGKDGVTLVEYGDYECPYCGEYFPTVKQVQAEYNQQITFQFRNFPLVSIHQNAFAGARAAEAAALQGKFWEMHDALYEEQNQWVGASDPTTFFNQYAQDLGLNVTQFESDYASTKVNDLINADMAEGNKLNIQGTPTFFLDGKQIEVANSASAFEKLINAAIAQKTTGSKATAPTSAGTTSQTAAPAKQ
ncbi:MAG TPA: thioredoxin domain-containing protein [Verrucomicrobiae bacterium]|jgi:protein-disulfide isomerase|nr:thioredoxin domain-containing protein [Verrucomicrobiae bacterium]